MSQRLVALLCYAIGIAIPLAFALFVKWYSGVWGFAFPFDVIGWLVILLMTFPFFAPFLLIGSKLRKTQASNRTSEPTDHVL